MQYIKSSRVKLNTFNNKKGLDRGAGLLKECLWFLTKVVFFLSPLPYPSRLKVALLRLFGAQVGKGVVIKPRVNIHFPWKICIGNYVWIGEEVSILNFDKTIVGDNVCISQRVFLCGGNHDFRDPSFCYRNAAIVLDDGCWIGACSFVAPGVTIGIDVVVTAGSVVTKSITANSIHGGNPAKYLGQRWYDGKANENVTSFALASSKGI